MYSRKGDDSDTDSSPHQWYWTYEYTDTLEKSDDNSEEMISQMRLSSPSSSPYGYDINFESYMKTTDSLEAGEFTVIIY